MARKRTQRLKKKRPSQKKPSPKSSRSRKSPDKKRQSAAKLNTPSPQMPLSGKKLWLFRSLFFVVIPFLLLICLEGGLRLFDYGVPTSFTLKQKIDGQKRILSNPYFVWRFLGPRFAATKGTHFSLPLKKPENTYRIFVLGASAAQGFPAPDYGMTRMLDVLLKSRYPGVSFETISAASPAINSHVVLPITRDCTTLQPDLFVLYLGNNEVVGPYGSGTVFTPIVSNLHVIRSGIALRASRFGQLLSGTFRKAPGLGLVELARFEGMASFADEHVRYTDPGMEIVYRHFGKNLNDICQAAKGAAVPILVSTVGVNLKDCPPFSSLHRKGLTVEELRRFEAHVKDGETLQEEGKSRQAIEAYLRAEDIDPEYAELHFRLGRCYSSVGDYAKAKAHFEKALELDALRFRADQRINGIIRQVVEDRSEEGIHLADVHQVLEANSPGRMAGSEAFYEHVHMNFHGTYLVARAFLEEMRQVLPSWVRQHATKGAVLSEEQCAKQLAYTGWNRLKIAESLISLMGKAPFTSQLDNAAQLRELSRTAEQLQERYRTQEGRQEVLAQYEAVLAGDDVHYLIHEAYAEFQYRALGNAQKAEKHIRKAIQDCPQSTEELFFLSEVLSYQGKHREAKSHVDKGLALAKIDPEASQIGTMWDSASAEKRWKELYQRAETLREQQNYGEGISASLQALAVAERTFGKDHPRVAMCLNNLASLRKGQGDYAEAESLYTRSLAIVENTAGKDHPNVAVALNNLAMTYLSRGEPGRAEPLLKRSLGIIEKALGPEHPNAASVLMNLSQCYERLGDRQKADDYRHRAMQIASKRR